MAGCIRTALTLGLCALAVLACRREAQQGAAAPQVASSTAPTLAAVEVPVSAGGATSAPLPPAPTVSPDVPAPPAQDSLRERAPLTDEQMVAVSDSVDQAALEQAKLAREQARDARVKQLAERLATAHGKLAQSRAELLTKIGIKAAPSALSDELATEAASSLATLKKARQADFDAVYVDAQVRAQQRYVELLDTQLIASAKNVDLKRFLEASRARAKAALDLATELRAARAPKPAADTSK